MQKIAEKLSSVGRSKERAQPRLWSSEEVMVQTAMVGAALRFRDGGRLDRAIADFGGLIDKRYFARDRRGESIIDFLFSSAEHPDAFGFERLLAERESELAPEKRLDTAAFGAWLRTGIYGSAKVEQNNPDGENDIENSLSDRSVLGYGLIAPVAAALCHDNPIALANVLGQGDRIQALLAMEPEGLAQAMDDGAAMAWYSEPMNCDHGKPHVERSILWNAIASKAYRCAALLASIPEFAAPFCEARRHVAGSNGFREHMHRANNSMRGVPFSEPNFWGWALRKGVDQSGSIWLSGADGLAWRSMIESMVDGASDSAKSWRGIGCGGWSDIFMRKLGVGSIDAKDEKGAESLEWCQSVLGRMSEHGFPMDWAALAKQCKKLSPMREWLVLQGVAKAGPSPVKRIRM